MRNIIDEIADHFSGCSYSNCYVGITDDPDRRLGEHGVDADDDTYIALPASSANVARNIEDYFLDKGMEGGSGGGSDDSNYVYVYKITSYTKE